MSPVGVSLDVAHCLTADSVEQLRLSKTYTWSLREETAEGSPVMHVIEHGISRIKHASDCVAVLLKELKAHANAGRCRIFCAVDLVNAFYRPTNLRRVDNTGIHVDDITIGRAFKKMLKNDWVCRCPLHSSLDHDTCACAGEWRRRGRRRDEALLAKVQEDRRLGLEGCAVVAEAPAWRPGTPPWLSSLIVLTG